MSHQKPNKPERYVKKHQLTRDDNIRKPVNTHVYLQPTTK